MRKCKSVKSNRDELLLDDIYLSDDPAIKQYLNTTMFEEMEKAHHRALMRVATQFAYKLSPQMQQVLAQQTAHEALLSA